jgi:alpha-amylase
MDPIRFVFGVHLHQPVGNFDHVFEQHVRDVYRPLLERLEARSFLPAVLHVSGPLLEWLEQHDPAYLDLLGRLAGSGDPAGPRRCRGRAGSGSRRRSHRRSQ